MSKSEEKWEAALRASQARSGEFERKLAECERERNGLLEGFNKDGLSPAEFCCAEIKKQLSDKLAECERERCELAKQFVDIQAYAGCLERKLAAAREALAPLWKGLMILHERLTTDWANRLDDPYELSGRLTGHDVIKLLAALTEAGEGEK